jgi:hypothetical protein
MYMWRSIQFICGDTYIGREKRKSHFCSDVGSYKSFPLFYNATVVTFYIVSIVKLYNASIV